MTSTPRPRENEPVNSSLRDHHHLLRAARGTYNTDTPFVIIKPVHGLMRFCQLQNLAHINADEPSFFLRDNGANEMLLFK